MNTEREGPHRLNVTRVHDVHLLLLPCLEMGWTSVRLAVGSFENVAFREVATAEDVLIAADSERWDVLLAPPVVRERPIIEFGHELGNLHPEISIIVIGGALHDDVLAKLPRAHVHACLSWDDLTRRTLERTLEDVIDAGLYVVGPDAMERLVESSLVRETRPAGVPVVTKRQLALIRHVEKGMRNKEIAKVESLSERAVQRERRELRQRLGVTTDYMLAIKVREYHLNELATTESDTELSESDETSP